MRLGPLGRSTRDPDLLAVGESTFPRHMILSAGVASGSGSMRLVYFTAKKSELTSSLRLYGGTTMAAGLTLARAGVYSVAANGDIALLGAIANDTTLFTTANTLYTRAITAPFQRSAGVRYALGLLVVGTTAPTLRGIAATEGTEFGAAPRLSGMVAGQTDLPASVAAASITDSAQLMYGVLLP